MGLRPMMLSGDRMEAAQAVRSPKLLTKHSWPSESSSVLPLIVTRCAHFALLRQMGALVGLRPDEIFGEVSPDQKAAVVAELQAQGRRVAMVGDGVNDTAALATALVGVAMSSGVGAAMEVADIVLQRDRVSQVVDAIRLSKATFGKIRQNLAWAFTYNIVGVPLAAGALLPAFGLSLTPSVAGAMMGASSLAVMGNSLGLRCSWVVERRDE